MNRHVFSIVLALALLGAGAASLRAQGTAFNYQGQLNVAGAPANGSYDLRFAVFDAVTNGNRASVWLTNYAVAVSNGLFTTTLGFGGGIFSGGNYWLDLSVRGGAETNFTTLTPRQPILPVPYAIFATTASNLSGTLPAAQLTGILPASQIAGTSANQVNFNNSANAFSGNFSGNGAALTGLNGSQITTGTVADARLTANVALLNSNQTFTGSNQFTGGNNFTNRANNFTGSFFGNGNVGWNVIPTQTASAQANHGYMFTGSQANTLTLPATASLLAGDIVRVSGGGSGGWFVQENAGQSVVGNLASYLNTYAGATNGGNYYGIAGSADGTRMYAVGVGFNGVKASSDSGQTWNVVGNLSGNWSSVACSANGKIVYVEPGSGGIIQVSSNSGLTWSPTAYSATGFFLACTADGSKLFNNNIACSGNGTALAALSGGGISVSNSAAGWFSIPAPAANVSCLGVSSDCTRLVAGVANGLLYASSNLGATWTPITSISQNWSGAWMSPDGSRFAATVSSTTVGAVYNFGVNVLPNTVSTNGTISGSQGAAVELQHVGNGQFMPISSSGILWAN